MIGTQIGSYEIIEQIGEGGMATVFRALQKNVDRMVAIKMIKQSIASDEAMIQRFQREARLIARLEHPHILPVYDFDGTYAPPYIVMRYVNGGTLRDVLNGGHLPADEIIQVIRQIGAALDYAHHQGIIHRDVKPSNIMVDQDGNAFLADLGIARITKPEFEQSIKGDAVPDVGAIAGTPDFMAPEQVMHGETIDYRADIYSLGVVAFQMMTGELPFTGSSPMAIMLAHLKNPIPKVSNINETLPAAMDAVISRAMAKTSEDRFGTAGDFAEEVENVLRGIITASSTSLFSVVVPDDEAVTRPMMTKEFATTVPLVHDQIDYYRSVTTLVADLRPYGKYLVEKGQEPDRALQTLWDDLASISADYGAMVMPQDGHTVTAIWGARAAHENDPERAVRCALKLCQFVQRETGTSVKPLPIKLGLESGTVKITSMDGSEAGVATGEAIIRAGHVSRYSDGVVLIAQGTFRQVRGIFDIQQETALRYEREDGTRSDLIPVYGIQRAKDRPFRIQARGVEGVNTATIGRNAELEILQKAYYDAVEDGETSAITLASEAGMGKSRILREFLTWIELQSESVTLLRARATPAMQHRPHALLRDMFMNRFNVLDSDSSDAIIEKLEQGIHQLTGLPAREMATLLAYLCGFRISPAALPEYDDLSQTARRMFVRLIRLACRNGAIYLQLEDIHHADDASLDLINELLRDYQDLPLLVAAATRPPLLMRRPDWGRGQDFHRRVELQPLDRRDSRDLAAEILQHVSDLPRSLRDFLVTRAEGNPYYMEELVKMLLEDRIVNKDALPWTVDENRLKQASVPPTLVGLLQARLDSLLHPERVVLQRAAMIGRVFYDDAVKALAEVDGVHIPDVTGTLDMLAVREFVFRREASAFEGVAEYVFAQAMVRDIIYDSLIDEPRKAYNLRAAQWLIQTAGDRTAEFSGLLADFYERAGETNTAAGALRKAGDQAEERGAYRDALAAYSRALGLLAEDAPGRASLLVDLGDVRRQLGDLDGAEQDILKALELAKANQNVETQADALRRAGLIAQDRGDLEQAQKHLVNALLKTRPLNDPERLILTLQGLGITLWQRGELDNAIGHIIEMQDQAKSTNHKGHLANAANLLGILHLSQERYDEARRHFQTMQTIANETGNTRHQLIVLVNLAEIDRLNGDYEAARDRFLEGLVMAEDGEFTQQIVVCRMNLGDVFIRLNQLDEAEQHLLHALKMTDDMGATGLMLYILALFSRLQAQSNEAQGALELLGLVREHAATDEETRQETDRILDEIRASGIAEDEVSQKMKQGATLNLRDVVDDLLVLQEAAAD